MKTTLWLSMTAVALVCAAPAYAQTATRVKNNENLMGAARYSNPTAAPAAPAPAPQVSVYRPGTAPQAAPPPAAPPVSMPTVSEPDSGAASMVVHRSEPYSVTYDDTDGAWEKGNEENYDASTFTGLYAGADVGYSIGDYPAADSAGPDGTVGTNGFAGGVFAGLGYVFWGGEEVVPYVGVEVGYEYGDQDGNLDGTDFEKQGGYRATFRPGIVIGDTVLAYGILGYSMTKFEVGNDDEDIGGYIFGGGAEFNTGTPISLRAEMNYVNYEEERINTIRFEGHDLTVKVGALARF